MTTISNETARNFLVNYQNLNGFGELEGREGAARNWKVRINQHKETKMKSKIEIKTKRLIIRPVQIGDETEIHEYAGDKEITMMFWLPNDTFEETADFVKRNAEEWNKPDQTNFEFLIIYDGKIIGG